MTRFRDNTSESPTIDELLRGRNNNFNLLRLAAAITVFISHVLVLKAGTGQGPSVIQQYLGTSASSLAVNAFFVLSGLLVTKSLLASGSIADYAVARGLRLFPAFAVLVLVLTFGLGLVSTTLSPTEYLSDLKTLKYWLLTSLTFTEVGSLPGVFASNPVVQIANGPVWTLKYEVLAYVAILILFSFGVVQRRAAFATFCGAFFIASIVAVQSFDVHAAAHTLTGNPWANLFRFGSCFLFGALCFVFRDKVKLNGYAVLVGFCAAYLLRTLHVYEIIAILAFGYAILWLSLVPSGKIRCFNRLGDYSYGIYIWHWPMIQTIIAFNPDISTGWLFVLSASVILPVSALSWHLIEKPALNARPMVTRFLQRLTRTKPSATAWS